MTRPAFYTFASLPAAIALCGLAIAPALAQGTPEQRAACAPDAVRLCPDTIPDVGRTKACMAAHIGELSSRCRTVFLGATRGPAIAAEPRRSRRIARAAPESEMAAPEARMRRRHIARAVPSDDEIDVPNVDVDVPDAAPSRAQTVRDARHARIVVNRLCRDAILDAGTCRFTNAMINLAD